MTYEEIMAQLQALPIEQRSAALKELGETSVELALATAKEELDKQRQDNQKLSSQIEELKKAVREAKPRMTVAELDAQFDQKLQEVATLVRKEADEELKKLRNELDKERVLSAYQDLPARYKSQVTGETTEDLKASAEAIMQEFKETEAEMRKRFLEQMGIDPNTDIEQVKGKVTIQQEQEENAEPEEVTLDALIEKHKGTSAETLLKQVQKMQQAGKVAPAQPAASIKEETPATASVTNEQLLQRFMSPHGMV